MRDIHSLKHKDKRVNIPTRELDDFVAEDEARPRMVEYPRLLYARDPSLDPQLVWKGKDEQDRQPLAAPSVPIYIQEKIHPQANRAVLSESTDDADEHRKLSAEICVICGCPTITTAPAGQLAGALLLQSRPAVTLCL